MFDTQPRINPTPMPERSGDKDHAQTCFRIDDLQHLKQRYHRLQLVTSLDQVGPETADDDTLVVVCDWLTWQHMAKERRHAVYYELGIVEYDRRDSLETDLFNHANDWLLDRGGDDPTLFHGVSVGRLFGSEMTMAVMNFYRLYQSLTALIGRFQPREIEFFDFKYDINHLTLALRREIVRDIAGEHDITFVDRSTDDAAGTVGNVMTYRQADQQSFRTTLANTYAEVLEILSRGRSLVTRTKRKALVLVNTNLAEPMAAAYDGQQVTPVFLARTLPKKLPVVLRHLGRGILFAAMRKRRLSATDKKRIHEIDESIRAICSGAGDGTLVRRFAHRYILQTVLERGTLEDAATDILMAEDLLDRFRPSEIVVDGVRSRRSLMFLELAKARSIKTNYIWHAPQTPQNLKMGALAGDPRQPVYVDRCLTWGKTNETWLDKMGARQEIARVGSPLRNRYLRSGKIKPHAGKPAHETNVMILQYGFNVLDLAGINANMYSAFVETARLLEGLGYRKLLLKMHPGPGRWAVSYFERIREEFGLHCDIKMGTPFHECLDWADIVIGPSHTGAMFETLAAGKPYHALLLPPHNTFDLSYFDNFNIVQSLDALPAAMETYDEHAAGAVLNDLYSVDDIDNPCERFWNALSQ